MPAVRSRRVLAWIALLGLLSAAATIWSGGDWMGGFRRMALTSWALYLLAGVGVAVARGRERALAAAGVAAIVIGHGAAALRAADHWFAPTVGWAALGHLAQRTPSVRCVALADIGRFGWAFRGSILDLGGLTDAHITTCRGRTSRRSGTRTTSAGEDPISC